MFESDLCKTNEEIAVQSREILQTFVWWKEGGGGGGTNLAPPSNVCKFSKICKAMSSLA